MTEANPWLSVIVPTYNGERFIGRALASVAAQEDEDLEVILVDDGSTDRTLEIARSFSGVLRMKIFEHEHTGNWVASTNVGLRAAEGDHVSFLHQDDEWLPGRAVTVRGVLRRYGPRVLLLHPVWFIDVRGRRTGRWTCPLPTGAAASKDAVFRALLVQNFICIAGAVFPRAVALEGGGLDEGLWYTADWDVWLRLVKEVELVLYLGAPLACFRVHPSAITATWSSRLDEFRWQQEAILERHLAGSVAGEVEMQRVEAAARFSVEVNVALAALAHGKRVELARLGRSLFRLGPRGWRMYLRNSRVWERVSARVRANAFAAFR